MPRELNVKIAQVIAEATSPTVKDLVRLADGPAQPAMSGMLDQCSHGSAR